MTKLYAVDVTESRWRCKNQKYGDILDRNT